MFFYHILPIFVSIDLFLPILFESYRFLIIFINHRIIFQFFAFWIFFKRTMVIIKSSSAPSITDKAYDIWP